MDSIEGEKGKSRRRTNGFHIVTSKKKGTARIAARMDDAENRARTAYINSRLRGKSWPGPTPFFFPFFLSEARCPIFLATRQEFLALYALLFKGAREAHTPFFLGRRVALIEPLSHTRTSHVSLSINDFYGRPPFLFLPRGRKDLTGLLPLARPRKNEKIGRGRRASIDERAAKKRRTGGGAGGEGEEGGVGDSVTYAFGEVDTGSANCYN